MSKIYLAGEIKLVEKDRILKAGIRRRLFSYHYHSRYDEHIRWSHEAKLDLFLDSGAFSAWNIGKPIELERYANFIKDYGTAWSTLSSLDSFGNDAEEGAKLSYENFRKLRALGLPVAPVFHVRERDYWLQKYIGEGETRILLGGMVAEGMGPWLLERLDHLFNDYICDNAGKPKINIHGFGLTAQKLLFRYPWGSCDSSSWVQKGFYGYVLFDITKPEGKPTYLQVAFSKDSPDLRKKKGCHFLNFSKKQQEQIEAWIAPFNLTLDEVIENYRRRDLINVITYQNMEKHIPNHFRGKDFTLMDLFAPTEEANIEL